MTKKYVLIDTDTSAMETGPTYAPTAPLPDPSISSGMGPGKFPESAYLVTKANHVLYDATSAATLTLTGSLPTVTFRCRITISSVTGHTDVAGSVTVGTEAAISFSAASTKTTTTNLSALPVITTAGLDCHILIEAITTGGAAIQVETLTPIDINFQDETEYYSQAIGGFTKRPAQALTDDTTSVVGDIVRIDSVDYSIRAIQKKKDRLGLERFRVLQF